MDNEERKRLAQIADDMMAELKKIDAKNAFDTASFQKKIDAEFAADKEFDDLSNLIESTVKAAEMSENPEFFNMAEFRDKMEVEFGKLGFREVYDKGIENILLVRLQAAGDFVNTIPAIREVRANYPYARITLVVARGSYELAEFCPYVNEVIPFDDVEVEGKSVVGMLEAVGEFARRFLWRRRFTLGFAFRHLRLSHILSLLMLYVSGARERVGYVSHAYRIYLGESLPPEKNPGNIFLTHPVINPKEVVHSCARMLYLLKDYGLQIHNTDVELWYDSMDLRKAKKLIGDFAPDRLKIAVGISSRDETRKYPMEKYIPALKEIISKGAAVIIFGGNRETADARFLAENLPSEFVKDICGVADRRMEAAILDKMVDMYIGNCTTTLDLAAAAKLPCIALNCEAEDKEQDMWGISYYSTFYPWQTEAIVLRPKHPLEGCEDLRGLSKVGEVNKLFLSCASEEAHCITQIEPQEIVAAYDEMIRYLKTSGIKRTIQPEIIRNIDATQKLSGLF